MSKVERQRTRDAKSSSGPAVGRSPHVVPAPRTGPQIGPRVGPDSGLRIEPIVNDAPGSVPRVKNESCDVAELLYRLALAEGKLKELAIESERRDRLATLGTISGMIAHEVNNLMTPVLTYAQLALAHPNDQALTKKALEHAASGAQGAAKVMFAILALAREEPADEIAGSAPEGVDIPSRSTWNATPPTPAPSFPRDACPVARAVDAAIACLGHNVGRDGVQIRADISADTIAPIAHVALQHIVLNLILNARNAIVRAGQRGASITICAGAESDELRYDPAEVWSRPWPQGDPIGLVIEVRDTGPGMERERVLRLFADHGLAEQRPAPLPGAQSAEGGHAEMSERGRARAGLGLEICRRLIEQAGGCLAIASTPGAGTRAWCVFPRHEVRELIANDRSGS